jgi:hypothetical protein
MDAEALGKLALGKFVLRSIVRHLYCEPAGDRSPLPLRPKYRVAKIFAENLVLGYESI